MLRPLRVPTAAVALMAAAAAVAAGPSPAAAHAGPGGVHRPAEDFESRVVDFDAGLDGLTATTPPGSGLLTLTNTTGATVTVRGYSGEAYLRVGPDGVFENTRSSATYLNADRTGATPVPADASPGAAPEWRRVGDGPAVTWHDHRTHWMLPFDPPEVQADPGVEHVVDPAWRVPVAIEGAPGDPSPRTVDIVGELRWLPPPSPGPWIALAAAVAGLLALGAAGRRWRATLTVGAVLVALIALADLIGMTGVSPGEPTALGVALPLAGAMAVLGGGALLRLRPATGVVVVGVAGLALGLLVGLTTRAALTHAVMPSALAPAAARAVVALALGAGTGLAVGAVVRQQVVYRRAVATA